MITPAAPTVPAAPAAAAEVRRVRARRFGGRARLGTISLIEDPVHPTTSPSEQEPERAPFAVPFAEVLAEANHGASWAWHQLHGAYAGRVRAYLRAQGAPEPDDLTSEVFLKVFARLSTFSGDEPQFRSWLFTVAHHQLIDDARRRRRRPVITPVPPAPERLVAGDAEHDALARVGEQWARELIASLPDAQREVVALRVIADLPLVDVAAVLGKRVGAVKSLQHRALAALRRTLGDSFGDSNTDAHPDLELEGMA
jgi:RNA polymerase sigma factor (sigma-70 family)